MIFDMQREIKKVDKVRHPMVMVKRRRCLEGNRNVGS